MTSSVGTLDRWLVGSHVPGSAGARLEVKVCGVRSEAEMHILSRSGVDHAGVWYGIREVPESLDAGRLARLCEAAAGGTNVVLVTLGASPVEIARVAREVDVGAVQLQGFELPMSVGRLRDALPARCELWKVLHVTGARCMEDRYLDAYAECGADAFVIDACASRGRVGSTGVRVPIEVFAELARGLGPERVFLAGGLTAGIVRGLRPHLAMRGVDLDSGVRTRSDPVESSHGRLDRSEIECLVQAAYG